MMPLRVGVDVDGVLSQNIEPICRRISETHGIEFTRDDVDEWNVDVPGLDATLSEAMEPYVDDRDYLLEQRMVERARETLLDLRRQGFIIVIITHRPGHTHDITKEWLSENSIRYHEYIHDVPDDKTNYTDIDVLIDDYHRNVQTAAENGTPAILFVKPWSDTASVESSENVWVEDDGWHDIPVLLAEIAEDSYDLAV